MTLTKTIRSSLAAFALLALGAQGEELEHKLSTNVLNEVVQ